MALAMQSRSSQPRLPCHLCHQRTIEKVSTWRLDLEITHSLGSLSFKVVAAGALHSLGKAKEGTSMTIRSSRVGAMGVRRQSACSATKGAKATKAWPLTSLDLMRGSGLVITMKESHCAGKGSYERCVARALEEGQCCQASRKQRQQLSDKGARKGRCF